MLEKSTVVKGLMSKEWECSSITERSTELIPKLVGQNGISVSTMVISEMEKEQGVSQILEERAVLYGHTERELSLYLVREECITAFLVPSSWLYREKEVSFHSLILADTLQCVATWNKSI